MSATPSMEFLTTLKSMLLEELEYEHEDLVYSMIQKYPQLLESSEEFLQKIQNSNSILACYLEANKKSKYMGSGLFRHCLKCQQKSKVIGHIDEWSCSNEKCKN